MRKQASKRRIKKILCGGFRYYIDMEYIRCTGWPTRWVATRDIIRTGLFCWWNRSFAVDFGLVPKSAPSAPTAQEKS